MGIFEFAMQKEKYSEDFYRDLAARSNNKGLQTIFTLLAEEEVKHFKIIEQMKKEEPKENVETTLLTDAKDIFEKMRKGVEKFDFDVNQIDIYKKAQDIEEQSEKFYLEKSDEIKEEYQKQIFLKLAQEEKKHYFLLDNIIEFVSRPELWLENAEFCHLEEY